MSSGRRRPSSDVSEKTGSAYLTQKVPSKQWYMFSRLHVVTYQGKMALLNSINWIKTLSGRVAESTVFFVRCKERRVGLVAPCIVSNITL